VYLLQERGLKSKNKKSLLYRLPPLESTEHLGHRFVQLGFPFLVAGGIAAAMWANEAWGTYWVWEPKQVTVLFDLAIYALYFYTRYFLGWRGRRGAWMIIAGFAAMTSSGPRWSGRVELIPEKLAEPLHWRKPRRVFVNSMSDLFHEGLPDEAIDRVFAVMAMCPQHQFQVLTKRPERMLAYFQRRKESYESVIAAGFGAQFILGNVWLGVSVEDQATADERIPLLLRTPAALRFVSYEPALGPVDFGPFIRNCRCDHCETQQEAGLDWVIAGGESGPGARPSHIQWFRDVRDQCLFARVPFHFKQWGEWTPDIEAWGRHCQNYHADSYDWGKGQLHVFDDGIKVWRTGKKAAGALLDGREWREFPS